MTRASLREYAAVQRERYLRAPRAEKHRLLNEVVAVTGLASQGGHPPVARHQETQKFGPAAVPISPTASARSPSEADLPGNAAGQRVALPGAVVVAHAGEPTPWGPETGMKIAPSFST